MHRCWDIAELVQLILEELDSRTFHGDEIESVNRPQVIALYHLAQTCRRLCDPALDVLWKATHGLVPLLKCLPTKSWEIRDGCFEVVSALNIDNWQRCLGYSRRVRTFSCYDGTVVVGQSAIESMMSLSPGTVLPNVRGLACYSSSVLFPYLDFLLGPRVEGIAITLDGPAHRASIMDTFSSYFRSLEGVRIIVTSGELTSGLVSSFVLQLPSQLRCLSFQGPNPATCRHLVTFPNLQDLEVLDLIETPFPGPYPVPSDKVFPALHTLKITTSNPLFAANFMAVLKDARLTRLYLEASEDSTTLNSLALFSAICAAGSPLELVEISILLNDDFERVLADLQLYDTQFDFIRALFVYSNLCYITLACPLGFGLDDSLLEIMARAWPRLVLLRIGNSVATDRNPQSSPTLATLLALCKHCAYLHSVYIALNTTMIPAACGHGESRSALSFKLKYWDPCDSSVQFPESVAEFLGTNFPMLSVAHISESWAQVDALLTARRAT
ncbi:hypothetical protein R3P38DRAFT_2937596 [Favolaschia claudopus]|uniref:F-box domain-containing protein n=1 Tax=Favolaschia claudopus TaxID=2862362 RepID=A0AAW0BNB1_9AGAR